MSNGLVSQTDELMSNSSDRSSADSQVDIDADDGWKDVDSGQDNEDLQYVCLFSKDAFGQLPQMLDHDRIENQFDILETLRRLGRCVQEEAKSQ